jgi:glucose-6-phosphate 1-dehydrogenase
MTAGVPVTARLSEAVRTPRFSARRAEPCTIVIFGASGDLTYRKLMPALFHLMRDGALAEDFAVVGIGTSLDHQSFRERIRSGLQEFGGLEEVPEGMWSRFADRLTFFTGDLKNPEAYGQLKGHVESVERTLPPGAGRLFYLAIPPSLYPRVIRGISESGLAPRLHLPQDRPWVRVVIEKPFGHSLDTARSLNATVRQALAEHQVYRIDHYLGKETVQNLLMFRFANSIFEPVWNRQHIDHVQITAAETVGVEHRAQYYEEAGVVRDMFQNHLLQLLTLTAMEPPVTFNADAVRDEKVKVLRAIRPIPADRMHEYAVRGQYGEGTIDGTAVRGYREEPDVAPDSATPTYAALRVMVDNWRWQGVPFYLRSGKRLPRRATGIAIQFRRPPHLMFPLPEGQLQEPNSLAMRIQPKEAIALRFEVKVPGVQVRLASVDMDFDYTEAFGTDTHEAYETLLLDCMLGEATLFTRSDEVEAAWTIVDQVIDAWAAKRPEHFPNYAAGSWGPAVADEFIGRIGCRWREP